MSSPNTSPVPEALGFVSPTPPRSGTPTTLPVKFDADDVSLDSPGAGPSAPLPKPSAPPLSSAPHTGSATSPAPVALSAAGVSPLSPPSRSTPPPPVVTAPKPKTLKLAHAPKKAPVVLRRKDGTPLTNEELKLYYRNHSPPVSAARPPLSSWAERRNAQDVQGALTTRHALLSAPSPPTETPATTPARPVTYRDAAAAAPPSAPRSKKDRVAMVIKPPLLPTPVEKPEDVGRKNPVAKDKAPIAHEFAGHAIVVPGGHPLLTNGAFQENPIGLQTHAAAMRLAPPPDAPVDLGDDAPDHFPPIQPDEVYEAETMRNYKKWAELCSKGDLLPIFVNVPLADMEPTYGPSAASLGRKLISTASEYNFHGQLSCERSILEEVVNFMHPEARIVDVGGADTRHGLHWPFGNRRYWHSLCPGITTMDKEKNHRPKFNRCSHTLEECTCPDVLNANIFLFNQSGYWFDHKAFSELLQDGKEVYVIDHPLSDETDLEFTVGNNMIHKGQTSPQYRYKTYDDGTLWAYATGNPGPYVSVPGHGHYNPLIHTLLHHDRTGRAVFIQRDTLRHLGSTYLRRYFLCYTAPDGTVMDLDDRPHISATTVRVPYNEIRPMTVTAKPHTRYNKRGEVETVNIPVLLDQPIYDEIGTSLLRSASLDETVFRQDASARLHSISHDPKFKYWFSNHQLRPDEASVLAQHFFEKHIESQHLSIERTAANLGPTIAAIKVLKVAPAGSVYESWPVLEQRFTTTWNSVSSAFFAGGVGPSLWALLKDPLVQRGIRCAILEEALFLVIWGAFVVTILAWNLQPDHLPIYRYVGAAIRCAFGLYEWHGRRGYAIRGNRWPALAQWIIFSGSALAPFVHVLFNIVVSTMHNRVVGVDEWSPACLIGARLWHWLFPRHRQPDPEIPVREHEVDGWTPIFLTPHPQLRKRCGHDEPVRNAFMARVLPTVDFSPSLPHVECEKRLGGQAWGPVFHGVVPLQWQQCHHNMIWSILKRTLPYHTDKAITSTPLDWSTAYVRLVASLPGLDSQLRAWSVQKWLSEYRGMSRYRYTALNDRFGNFSGTEEARTAAFIKDELLFPTAAFDPFAAVKAPRTVISESPELVMNLSMYSNPMSKFMARTWCVSEQLRNGHTFLRIYGPGLNTVDLGKAFTAAMFGLGLDFRSCLFYNGDHSSFDGTQDYNQLQYCEWPFLRLLVETMEPERAEYMYNLYRAESRRHIGLKTKGTTGSLRAYKVVSVAEYVRVWCQTTGYSMLEAETRWSRVRGGPLKPNCWGKLVIEEWTQPSVVAFLATQNWTSPLEVLAVLHDLLLPNGNPALPSLRSPFRCAAHELANVGRTTGSPLTTVFNTAMAYPDIQDLAERLGVVGFIFNTGDDALIVVRDDEAGRLFGPALEQREFELGFTFKVTQVKFWNNGFCGCNFVWTGSDYICVRSPERVLLKLGWLRQPNTEAWNREWARQTVYGAALNLRCVPHIGRALYELAASSPPSSLRLQRSVTAYIERERHGLFASTAETPPCNPHIAAFYVERWQAVGVDFGSTSDLRLSFGAQHAPRWLLTLLHAYASNQLF
jgi:hypothetical protein